MTKALDQEMYHYFTRLNDAEKKSVIMLLKTFLKSRKEEPEQTGTEESNKELEQDEAAYNKGDFISEEEMLKQIRKW
jgi:hypothetical protein